ncbi:Hint domain-containing protein [Pseudohalocynthiibacter sp. F2068]|jgi:Hint domain|uniref:Hint domain-containing protein n=1 Tax=Pseudohalocynthiibacter sp. F2068 TaxID=2926418 RepID=UPI001FF43497|nr:Hint domain-containing protein [Pseudohalocynthiibacter sp. F2068]MCK0103610.1 Hint domain-containing protein [Pseudohalocynthiibacter sp. F2068]
MPQYTVWVLPDDNITLSSGQLDGITQGDGSHLVGKTLTINDNTYQPIVIDDNEGFFADNDGSQRLQSETTLNGVTYAANTRVEAEYKFTATYDGVTYEGLGFNVRDSYPSYATIEGVAWFGPNGVPPGNVSLLIDDASEGNAGGAVNETNLAVPCFTPGTMLDAPDGPVPVETVATGDWLLTRDDGPQQVLWRGCLQLSALDLHIAPQLRPVMIRKGSLGPNRPSRDMVVSPQHRVLLDDWRAEYFYGESELLVPAKHQINDQTIRRITPENGISYIHILFERHQIVFSDGLPSESYHPAPNNLGAFSQDTQEEFYALFPEFVAYGPSARPSLKAWESAVLSI